MILKCEEHGVVLAKGSILMNGNDNMGGVSRIYCPVCQDYTDPVMEMSA